MPSKQQPYVAGLLFLDLDSKGKGYSKVALQADLKDLNGRALFSDLLTCMKEGAQCLTSKKLFAQPEQDSINNQQSTLQHFNIFVFATTASSSSKTSISEYTYTIPVKLSF